MPSREEREENARIIANRIVDGLKEIMAHLYILGSIRTFVG